MTQCPCGSKKSYDNCCGPFLAGSATPKTPEELMRSRYTAFTKADIDYVAKTMKGQAAKDFDRPDTKRWMEQSQWLSLEILDSGVDKKNPSIGFVDFIAKYIEGKKARTMHEISQFHLENGRWYYIDGKFVGDKIETQTSNKIGRNDPCPCGSGKKFKKCCGKS